MPRRRTAVSAAPSLRELDEKIEKWAPPKYRAERKRLYADLRATGIAFEVMLATQHVRGFRYAESASLKWQKDYWRRRKTIEKQIEDIRANPLVLRLEDPKFRELGLPCPHDRERLECEEIRQNLLAYRSRPPYPGAKNMVRAAAERKERARKSLADYKFHNPDLLNPADFCESSDLSEPWDQEAPTARPGRPPTLRMELLKDVMIVLKRRRLSQQRKLEYVARVLRYCFGDDKADAEELAARWRDIRRREPKPDASGWVPIPYPKERRKSPC